MGAEAMSPKPCPWCGCEEFEILTVLVHGESWLTVECEECMARGPHFESVDRAVAAWNKRSKP